MKLVNVDDVSFDASFLDYNPDKDILYVLRDNDETEGYAFIKVMQTLNEYKLGTLSFNFDVDINDDVFNDFLKEQIINNFVIKIVCDFKNDEFAKITFLKRLGFIVTKEENERTFLKITKPIFLSKGR